MNRRWKLALAALLGFSTACSTVRRTPAETEPSARETADSTAASRNAADSLMLQSEGPLPRIRLMYGVPSPRPEAAQPTENKASAEAETAR